MVDLRGNFNGVTLYADAAYNLTNFGGWNYYNLTGDSSWNNGALNIINFNGHKLDMTGSVTNFAASGLGVNVGTGTMNNPGTALTTISNGNIITLAGGSITGIATSPGGFAFTTGLRGYGTISTPVTLNAGGSLGVSGGTLTVLNTTLTNPGGSTVTVANDGLSGVQVTNSTVNWGNFTTSGAYISDPSTQTFNTLTVNPTGFIQAAAGDTYIVNGNFTNNSTQTGSWNTSAAILKFAGGGTHNFTLAADGSPLNSWGTLDLTGFTTGETLSLAGPAGAALYVSVFNDLLISGGVVNDVTGNGFNIFYDPTTQGDQYLGGLTYNLGNGGILAPVPIPPSALLLGTGLLGIVGLGWRRRKFSQA